MQSGGIAEKVRELAEPTVRSLGYDIWDVRYVKEGGENYLRVFIDSPNGVGIDDCVEVSRAVDPLLDREDIVPCAYCFEVCTPGIERELTRPEHFNTMRDRDVKVRLFRPAEGRREFTGKLAAYDGVSVTVLENGVPRTFAMKAVSSVKLNDFNTGDEEENG